MVAKKRRTPTPKKPTTCETAPVGPSVEFHNVEEDAWYNVQLVLLCDTLIVKYTEFQYEQDLEFRTDIFETSDDIERFKRRFRPLSVQLEASDCGVVEVGIRVCALLVHSEDDRRFYDAIVESINREEHSFVGETENCSCTIVLSWLHGPNAGTLTTARVEDLCLILSDKPLDPRVACFLELAMWKQGIASPCSKLITKDIICKRDSPTSFQGKPLSVIQDSGWKGMGTLLLCDEEYFGHERDEDVDLGGGGGVDERHSDLYTLDNLVEAVVAAGLGEKGIDENKNFEKEERSFIMVENLEKDVSPSTIVEFVKQATGLEIDAFVFMNLSSEPYTRGALVVNCREDLERLCNFVVQPGQMITSSKGRPWIVTDSSSTETVRPSFWCLEPDFKDEKQQTDGNGLKLVELGSEEYCKAEKMRDVYLDFANHQELLFEKLGLEEQNILHS